MMSATVEPVIVAITGAGGGQNGALGIISGLMSLTAGGRLRGQNTFDGGLQAVAFHNRDRFVFSSSTSCPT